MKELRSFLGLVSYCRNFIKDLAAISATLYDILKGSPSSSAAVVFTEKERECFNSVKNLISSDSCLLLPDYTKEFIVTTDASGSGMSGILAQVNPQKQEQAICFFSKKFTDAQSKYSATQRELLAVVESLKFFKPYLLHKKFVLRTDHQALVALKHTRNTNSLLFRWSLLLAEFDFKIEYIKGEKNPADALSRIQAIYTNAISSPSKKIIIDQDLQNKILNEYHIELGHGSAGNMLYNIKKKYEWVNLYTQTHEFVKKCKICSRAGTIRRNTNFFHNYTSHPGDLIEIDLIGPLPMTGNGNKFVITAIDNYSKLAMSKPIPSKSPFFIIQFIKEEIMPKFEKITVLSDNGLEFKATETQNFAKQHGIAWNFGAPYHPQTQGAIERFNSTLQDKLKKLCDFGRLKWDRMVEKAVSAYNRSFHRVLGASPYEFFNAKIPIFNIDSEILSKNFKVTLNKHQLDSLKNNIEKKYSKEFHGKIKMKEVFNIGDHVLYYKNNPPRSKLEAFWEAGFIIEKIHSEKQSYTIRKGNKLYEASKIHLKTDHSV